jgi:hypothetical protein
MTLLLHAISYILVPFETEADYNYLQISNAREYRTKLLGKEIPCRTVTGCFVAGIRIDVPTMLRRAAFARSNAFKTRVEKLAVARVRQEYGIRCFWTLRFWLATCRGTTFRLSGK